jgi:hypothetical protein
MGKWATQLGLILVIEGIMAWLDTGQPDPDTLPRSINAARRSAATESVEDWFKSVHRLEPHTTEGSGGLWPLNGGVIFVRGPQEVRNRSSRQSRSGSYAVTHGAPVLSRPYSHLAMRL